MSIMWKSNLVKVITYGTYDLLHYGHIRLLEQAKALGDYLIVGITKDANLMMNLFILILLAFHLLMLL